MKKEKMMKGKTVACLWPYKRHPDRRVQRRKLLKNLGLMI